MLTSRHHSAVTASSSQCHSLNSNANANANGNYYNVSIAEQHQKQQKLSEHFKDSGRHFTAGGLAGELNKILCNT
jgi:hypothetical protein